MNEHEQIQFDYDLSALRRVMKDDENNGGPYDRYVVAARLVLEKSDELERHANQVPGLGPVFTAVVNEYRALIVNTVLFDQDELASHKKDVTP